MSHPATIAAGPLPILLWVGVPKVKLPTSVPLEVSPLWVIVSFPWVVGATKTLSVPPSVSMLNWSNGSKPLSSTSGARPIAFTMGPSVTTRMSSVPLVAFKVTMLAAASPPPQSRG